MRWIGLMLIVSACSHGQLVEDPPPEKSTAVAKTSPKRDFFADFGGRIVDQGTPVRLEAAEIVGIRGANVTVQLLRTDWTTRELPDGSKAKEATANLEVRRGEEGKTRRIDQGETRTVMGVKVTVIGAGEKYSAKRMDYVPWVKIVVR